MQLPHPAGSLRFRSLCICCKIKGNTCTIFMCSYYIYHNIQIIYSHILCYILTPWGSNQIELENLQGISWQQVGSTNLASGPSAAICSRCPCNVLFKAFEGTHNLPTHTPEPLPLPPPWLCLMPFEWHATICQRESCKCAAVFSVCKALENVVVLFMSDKM